MKRHHVGAAILFTTLASCAGGAPRTNAPPVAAPQEHAPSAPEPRADGRLPKSVTPLHYALALTIDPREPRFRGETAITSRVDEPTWFVVVNGRDMHVAHAEARTSAGTIEATVTPRKSHGALVDDELVLAFAHPLPKGEATIALTYDAPFADDLSGAYRVKDGDAWYAFTQFESTDARRAFPCFDEPSYKVPFDVSITAPKGMIAVSNAKEKARTGTETTRFDFEATPPLPSYLVAFAVGDLDVLEGAKTPIPLRLIATKGKAALGKSALEKAATLVTTLGDYYGIPYPYPKLDLVAVPDFGAGAMENAGFITFREELLLLDPDHAPLPTRRRMALVIAHELAHQWFGDLVTMEWWNDLWLNEGFASWMERRGVDRAWPAFGSTIEELSDTEDVMDLDARKSARAVRQPVTSTSDAEEAFDGITYDKGAAVLTMIEGWIGEQNFRDGVTAYLKAHAWKNATAEDLLASFGQSSGKNVAAMASTFLDHPGVPNVSAQLNCEPKGRFNIELRQEPWRPIGSLLDPMSEQSWITPVCVAAEGQKDALCTELAERGPVLVAGKGKCPAFIDPNAREKGYYRSQQDEAGTTALVHGASSLDVVSRMGIVRNLWAQTRAGNLSAAYFLKTLPAFDGENDRHVIAQIIGVLRDVSAEVIEERARPAFRAYVAARLGRHKKALGWGISKTGAADDHDDERALLRRDVLLAMGDLAEDATTLREADAIAVKWLADPTSVDSDAAQVAVELASHDAKAERLDALWAAMKRAKTPQDRIIALRATTAFADPALLQRGLDAILTDTVKIQDIRYVLFPPLTRESGRRIAYAWTKKNWDALHAKLSSLTARAVGVAGAVCTREELADAKAFFTPRAKTLEGAERPLAEALEGAKLCAELRAEAGPAASRYLLKLKK